jgi:hypothetical protein
LRELKSADPSKVSSSSGLSSQKQSSSFVKLPGLGTIQGIPMLNNSHYYHQPDFVNFQWTSKAPHRKHSSSTNARDANRSDKSGDKLANETPMNSEILCAGLARMCHVIDSLSAVLNIPLLHPLFPFEFTECCVAAQCDRGYVLKLLTLCRVVSERLIILIDV